MKCCVHEASLKDFTLNVAVFLQICARTKPAHVQYLVSHTVAPTLLRRLHGRHQPPRGGGWWWKVRVGTLIPQLDVFRCRLQKHQPAVLATFTIPHEPASGPSQLGAERTIRRGCGGVGVPGVASTCTEALPAGRPTQKHRGALLQTRHYL